MQAKTAALGKAFLALIAFAACASSALARPFNDPRDEKLDVWDSDAAFSALPRDPACHANELVATGGKAPTSAQTLAVRWTGYSNFELAYKGKVILLDAYFDRGALLPKLGFAAADIKKADAILLGHGHFDHMSDAASVAKQTGATVVGAPVTVEKLKSQSLSDAQIKTVTGKGGERLQFDGFTVEPILARHGTPSKENFAIMEAALAKITPPVTPEQAEEQKRIAARGTFDPRVIGEGTIAYLITLDDGFRIMYRDSGGKITEQEKAAMARVNGVDLALVAISADYLNPLQEAQALEHAELYKPDVYMPAHHDGPMAGRSPLWRSTEPVFQALKDTMPNIVTVSREYREPVCFDTRVNISQGRKR
jgi:L-ascorbate metabolism protein UlaG (beta-lactamase superfamily)